MRHGVFGTKLSRTSNERKRLLVVLTREVFKHGAIKTTLAKAKAVQPMIEKLITRAKKDKKPDMDRFSKRTSGYTRIVRLGERLGDRSELVLLSLVDPIVTLKKIEKIEVKTKGEKIQEKAKPKKRYATTNKTNKR